MRTTKRNRRNFSLFQKLESRQHLAVDLTAGTAVPVGAYADGDLFDVSIKLKNSGSSNDDLPVYVTVTLSKDNKLGNADDITGFSGSVFLGAKKGKTATNTEQVSVRPEWAAGDYYVVTQVDPYNSDAESNENNNITFSAKKDIRIVTDTIQPGEVVRGTPKNDNITTQSNWANEIVTMNGVSRRYKNTNLQPLTIGAGKGNDKITIDSKSNLRHVISGNAGNDTISGGNYDDVLYGDAGNDRLYGNGGMDILYGGSSNDILVGGAGIDNVQGQGGKDKGQKDTQDTFSSVETIF